MQAAYAGTAPVTGRTEAQITSWFNGLLLARPGLVDVRAWRPDDPRHSRWSPPSRARFLVGVAWKPSSNRRWQP